MEAPLVDYNLTPRPQGRGVDIGPFEFVPHESRLSERSCGDFRAGKMRDQGRRDTVHRSETQQARIKDRLDAALARVLAHGQYIMGPEVAELEASLSAFCGAPHTVACASGTDALALALMALGVRQAKRS